MCIRDRNQSYTKFGMEKGKGRSYEAILTVKSIAIAQKYYDLLNEIKQENDELKICEKVKKALPDFPKFAITYSVSENEEASKVNQDKMQKSLDDYNQMFGTSYKVEGISAYTVSYTHLEENDAYFLLTDSEIWSNTMKRMAASGTMQIVNKTEFSELKTMVPSLVEQQAIGTYFHNLDHLITLHQCKCKSCKKYYKCTRKLK